MADSTTNIDQISSTQANKELTMNALTDAASPAMLWGRRAPASIGLTWGYYGGRFVDNAGTAHTIANGTVTLSASTTTYIYADNVTGAVSSNTTGFPVGKVPLYSVVTGASQVTSWLDYRSYQPSATASNGGSLTLAGLSDVSISGLSDKQFLQYSASLSKWTNVGVSGATITPFALAGMATSTQYKPSGGYTAGTVLIMKNGSLLTPGASADFTATDGTNVNFAVAVKTGDQLLYISLPSVGGVTGGGASKDAQGFYLANNPVTTGFTLSQSTSLAGAASMSNLASGRGFNIVVPCQSSADNNAFVNKAAPGGSSWAMTAMLVPMVPTGNASNYSLAVQDASGKIVLFGFDAFAVKVAYGKWTNINTFSTRVGYSAMPLPPGVPVWMRLTYASGGNFVFSMSSDGETFAQMFAVSVTDFISTPSACGVWVDHNLGSTSTTTQIAVSVMSFAAA
ncbi:hypothetical protein [Burkholderia cenocepacia]|uniref:hypothetical protein n=1 Tax=Burkholderia cenocepacia TaxID=95486 RepID=UPI00158D0A5F|nr:hypothetical protein [Burkholderia cenocepacia]